MTRELVVAKTRLSRSSMLRLERLARRNGRSIASELRLAIANHLKSSDSGKDESDGC